MMVIPVMTADTAQLILKVVVPPVPFNTIKSILHSKLTFDLSNLESERIFAA